MEVVGAGVTRFRPGDAVFGAVSATFAELVCAPEDKLAPLLSCLDFGQAAAVPSAGLTALQGLRNTGEVRPGMKVLVNGASGGVGSFAVQIAKAFGAEVTGVCSTRNLELVRSLGADRVVDYTAEDFTRGAHRYDLIMDQVGNHRLADLRRVLTPEGRTQPNTGHGGMGYVFKSLFWSMVSSRHGKLFVTKPNHEDLLVLKDLIESGKIRPVIDRTYPLSEVPSAMGYAEQGHVQGKVVIIID